MIFLSHTSSDKILVEPIYLQLKEEFPNNEIFYDEVSIQPGDSIVGKMSEGLGKNNLFLLFWSNSASKSKMVEREWQAALSKAISENDKFIVVVLDRTPLPQILKDYKYLDFYSNGFGNTLNSIKNLIIGENVYTPKYESVENLVYSVRENSTKDKWTITFEAIHSVEYGIVYFVASDSLDNIKLTFDNTSGVSMGGGGTITLGNQNVPATSISTMHKFISPGTPETIIISISKNTPLMFYVGVQTSSGIRIIGQFDSQENIRVV